jgi:hypothetical protein
MAASAVGVPFEVAAATAITVTLNVSLDIDPDYVPEKVIADVITLLSDALSPEKLGIGGAVIRSKVLALAASVAGVIAPKELYIDGYPYLNAGYRPPMGTYIEFTSITAGH